MNNNKILILAPHQDDEIILCGGFLNSLVEQAYQVYVVYMTNGDYEADIGEIRLLESLKAVKGFGIPEDQIIFMGYANEYDINGPHIYNAPKGQIVKSQYGNQQTYGLKSHPEYCFINHGIHHTYCRENLICDLFEILKEIKPAIIFATDAEVHPDHKANSLFLDEVLGKILHTEKDYTPIVLKKPEYSTSWFNREDYSQYNNRASELACRAKVNGELTDFSNPYMRWRDRTRLPIDLSVRTPFRKENSLWNALKQYESQNAILHYKQMLNSDVTFWPRRTDSLTYHSCIETSSGDSRFLNDFKIIDSEDIKRRSQDIWSIGASVWRPERSDVCPSIKINWGEKKTISTIVFYQEFCPVSQIIKSHILLEDGRILTVGMLHKRRPTVVTLNSEYISGFTFIIDECSNNLIPPGISEIEVYEEKSILYSYLKLLIDDNFVYRYIASGSNMGQLSIYLLDELGFSHTAELNEVSFVITDLFGKVLKAEDYIDKHGRLLKKPNPNFRIQVFLKSNPQLEDTVLVFRDSWKEDAYWHLVAKLRQIKIPMKDISKLEKSVGFEKLDYIRMVYQVAKIKRNYDVCTYLRMLYLYYQIGCKKRRLLTDYQIKESETFLLFGECMPDSSRCIKEYILGKKRKISITKEKKIFFVGTPSHYNLGDHIISYATKAYLKRVLSKAPIIEVTIQEFPSMLGIIERVVNKDDIFILQGGGNMGNIYWTNERIRREIIKRFPNNHIIIFPETIYYENTVYGETDKEESQYIYDRAKHLTICAREEASYSIMKKVYKHADIILTPDIVCSYKFEKLPVKTDMVKLFFREDREKRTDEYIKREVEHILTDEGYPYIFSDMMYRSKGYIGKANRDYIVKDKIREIGEAKLIITDRLHAMILCVLTRTPCIVFYGYNHKIESTYHTWFYNIPYIMLVDDTKQLVFNMDKVIREAQKIKEDPEWDKAFKPLFEVLTEVWK